MTSKLIVRDQSARADTIENCIRLLSAEILRITKLSYTSKCNREKICSLDHQIQYLEELLAAYERDYKKHV